MTRASIPVENIGIRTGVAKHFPIAEISQVLLESMEQTSQTDTLWDMNLDINWFGPASDQEFEATILFTALDP